MRLNPQLTVAAIGALGMMVAITDFTKPHEGLSLTAYLDTVAVPTICYGKTQGVTLGMKTTQEKCEQYLQVELKQHCEILWKDTDPSKIPVGVFISTCDWLYQYGGSKYRTSTIRKLLLEKNYRGVCGQFTRWKYAGGKDCSYKLSNCYGVIERNIDREELCYASF